MLLPRLPWVETIAVDMGTWQTHICVRGHGVVVREPSLVAYAAERRRPLAFGTEARKMLQRGVEGVTVVQPVRGGMVADFDAAVAMLRHFLHQATGRRLIFSPDVLTCISAGVTSVQRRAAHGALHSAGTGRVNIVETPLAVALGAGVGLNVSRACLVVDIGAGVTDVGVFCEGMVTSATFIPFGGDNLDEAIVRGVKRRQGQTISRTMAETLKLQVGSLNGYAGRGGSASAAKTTNHNSAMMPGLPEVDVSAIPEILAEGLTPLVDELRWILENLPRQQRAEVEEEGILLSGGCSLLDGLESYLARQLGLPVTTATDPMSCTILGLETILEDLSALSLGGRRLTGYPPPASQCVLLQGMGFPSRSPLVKRLQPPYPAVAALVIVAGPGAVVGRYSIPKAQPALSRILPCRTPVSPRLLRMPVLWQRGPRR